MASDFHTFERVNAEVLYCINDGCLFAEPVRLFQGPLKTMSAVRLFCLITPRQGCLVQLLVDAPSDETKALLAFAGSPSSGARTVCSLDFRPLAWVVLKSELCCSVRHLAKLFLGCLGSRSPVDMLWPPVSGAVSLAFHWEWVNTQSLRVLPIPLVF